ncbi:efflux RND transporter periplasmic adaptor subunit [Sulfitobacter sabulilitoris]|uniref:HlyD family efflux transporter periplasmic adaptor subunit n=1 Tax=Sulfitobacter sabulilitoris TaxID=2562655 RepID=A0A5S3PC95_9RHOB|nr:HlyD family efflux transporter periplasmic adaptor subunit [Sulfitobacter sabulilitoris]TMM51207.1 HlyD family efflux transporter periplasmic adaptor subunit [Sulfitobacter sabulilitoris]
MAVSKRTLGLMGLGAGIVAVLLYVTVRPEPVAVDLHDVRVGPMTVTIDADGKTRIRDLYEVSAPISGTARRSPVEVGDRVIAGETVVAIVEPVAPSLLDARSRIQAEAAVREAEASLHVAQTELLRAQEDQRLARSQFDRTQTLMDRGVASVTQLEDAAQRLAVTTAAVEAAQARIDMARGSLERSRAALIEPTTAQNPSGGCCVRIFAPSDGVVLSVVTISERPVLAGAPLLSIGDPTDLELVVDLLSNDAVRLAPGVPAKVTRWGGDTPLDAVLNRVEPAARTKVSALGIEEQRVDAIFDLVTPLKDRPGLGDGFSVFVHIIEWQAEEVMQVPVSALFRRGDGWAVFRAIEGVAQEMPVQIGQRNTRMAQVLDGLSPGDRVIVHPSDAISAGSLIRERDTL